MSEIDLKLKNQHDMTSLMFKQNADDHKSLKLGIDRIEKKLSKQDETLADYVKTFDKRYAPIWTKDVLVWVGGSVGVVLITYAVARIFIK